MSNLDLARFQFAYTLAFHMIFASFGVGMPFLMFLAEGLYLRTKNDKYKRLAKTWAKVTSILFAVGAVSGTVISFELGLLWPRFMGFAGSTIGAAFALEGFAFFTEAIFIAIYLYGWDRVPPLAHWLAGGVVALAGASSSVLVVATNAWMQWPVDVDILLKNPALMDPAKALFTNPHWGIMTLHSTIATYCVTAFIVAGVYAWGALKGRKDEVRQAGIKIALAVGFVAALIMPVTGHISAQVVAKDQPTKLAAMEAQFRTERGAPLRIGGVPNMAKHEVDWVLEIPGGLSYLSFSDFNAEIKGLEEWPKELWPNVPLVHYSFQLMVASGMAMPLVSFLWFFVWKRRGAEAAWARWLMWVLVFASPLGLIGLETGWIVTEVGRQPWVIYGIMKTAEAVTTAEGLGTTTAGFVLLYVALGAVTAWMLSRLRHA